MRTRILAAALCALAVAVQPARADAATDVLPDLVGAAPDSPSLDNYTYSDGSHDLLLRFNDLL